MSNAQTGEECGYLGAKGTYRGTSLIRKGTPLGP